MKFGNIDFNDKLGKLSFEQFKKYFKPFRDRVKETPEQVFEKLGGKVPKPRKKKEDGGE